MPVSILCDTAPPTAPEIAPPTAPDTAPLIAPLAAPSAMQAAAPPVPAVTVEITTTAATIIVAVIAILAQLGRDQFPLESYDYLYHVDKYLITSDLAKAGNLPSMVLVCNLSTLP